MDIKGHNFILNCKLLFPCISLDERATFQKFTHRLLHCAKVEHENNPHGKTCINPLHMMASSIGSGLTNENIGSVNTSQLKLCIKWHQHSRILFL